MSEQDISARSKKLLDLFEDNDEIVEGEELPPLYQELLENNQRYCKESFVAEGGMKRISKVYDQLTKRNVAMARLIKRASQELYDPFIREAHLTALLTHPNIIPVYDVGIGPMGAPFFTMELKEGDSLKKIINKLKDEHPGYTQKYSQEVLLNIFLKICDAIAYAHSHKVVHLDLKPDNIQVGNFGEVLVCDWGLGKVIGSKDFDSFDGLMFNPDFLNNITHQGEIKGTPGFMAPEQIHREDDITEAADIYALGCLLYTILFFESPFDDGSDKQIIQNNLEGKFDFPNQGISDGLKSIIYKAMKFNSYERYQSVDLIRKDIQKYLLGFSPSADKPSFLRQAKLLYRRNKAQCHIVLSFIIIIAVLTTVYFLNIEERRKEAEIARELAEKKQLQLQTEKERTDQALALLEKEREWRNHVIHDHSNRLESDVLSYLFHSSLDKDPTEHMERTFLYLDRLIEADPNNKKLYSKRARAHFMIQNFSQSKRDFDIAQATDTKNTEIQKLSEKYSNLIPEGQKIPENLIPDFTKDLTALRDHYVKYKVLNCYLITKPSLNDKLSFIQNLIQASNPNWDHENFKYHSEVKALEISGKNLKNIGYTFGNPRTRMKVTQTYFNFLPINYLKIMGMKKFPQHFESIGVSDLDLSLSPISITQEVLNMKQLKNLILSEKQFKEIQKLKIPSNLHVSINNF
ncbi:protein kinase [Lentisphaera profundi]|uniref:Protein kinase n=1 Tax=Lentisphaera profundi TaxID=1658616 RepID=A0ABY7VS67_9BACT|nr:serine/threonine-protein kinase [Lentisphaera profundi]WDE97055.1 protein kinase [Lentisphaera profundi]